MLGLNEGDKSDIKRNEIEKAFDYEEDIEELGKKLDKQNREKLKKEELDCIFVTDTNVLNDLNALRNGEKENFEDNIETLKKEALETEILFTSEDFDIFGGVSEDKTKINTLGNTKHREITKSKFRILDITKNTNNEQYVKIINEIIEELNSTIERAQFGYKLNAFYASTTPLDTKNYNHLYINPKNALEQFKNADKINLYNIKLKERTKGIALTNIAYYDNTNKTLPLGMMISDKVLIDMSKIKLELKKQKLFRINQDIDDINVKTKIICLYEYEETQE